VKGPVDNARDAWGEDVPDWVLALAQASAATSQNRVAEDIGRSASVVSAVLRKKYLGNMNAIEERVRGVFMSAVISCPVLGDMPTDVCQMWRQRANRHQGHNTHRVRMFHACRRCPRYIGEEQS